MIAIIPERVIGMPRNTDRHRPESPLNGQQGTLERVANCFQGDIAQIKKVENTWFLESSAFNVCTNAQQVLPIADELLRFMNRVAALYMRLWSPFEIGYVQAFDDKGAPIPGRTLRTSVKIDIYSSAGLRELQSPLGERSLGSAVVDIARANKKVQDALALVGEDNVEWPQLYNILEFLGAPQAIAEKNWASKNQIRKCWRTANYHRHLGSPKKNSLPADPPSLSDATSLVFGLLKKWISEQL